jgi:hypothetical protein
MPTDDGLTPVRAILSTIAARNLRKAKYLERKSPSCLSLPILVPSQIVRKIRQRKLSSREAVDYFLTRVEVLDKPINSVVTIDAARARTARQRVCISPLGTGTPGTFSGSRPNSV